MAAPKNRDLWKVFSPSSQLTQLKDGPRKTFAEERELERSQGEVDEEDEGMVGGGARSARRQQRAASKANSFSQVPSKITNLDVNEFMTNLLPDGKEHTKFILPVRRLFRRMRPPRRN